VPSSNAVAKVVVTLNIRNPGALDLLVNSVSNPNSPYYAQFITENQFIQEFSPPQSVVTQLSGWLAQKGIAVTYVAPDYRSLDAQGTLGELSSAFDVSFANYASSSMGGFYAPTTSPSLPQALAPWVQSVAGLSNVKIPIKDDLVMYSGLPSPAASAGQHTATRDPTFHQIYQLDQLYNSTGNATAGVHPSYAVGTSVAPALWNDTPNNPDESGPFTYPCIYATSDLATFFNSTDGYPKGLPAVSIQPHYSVPSWVGLAPNVDTCASAANDGADGEVAMDFEAVGSTAPGANISYTWVAGSGNWLSFIAMMNYLAANDEAGRDLNLNSISESWGAPEMYDCTGGPCLSTAYETDFKELGAFGVSIFASSADEDGTVGTLGTTCKTGAANAPSLQEPSSFPDNTNVGGIGITSAMPGATSTDLAGAQVWNWGCVGTSPDKEWVGSQGGVSALFPRASYQYGYNVNSSMAFGITAYGSNGGTVYSATSARPGPDWSGLADNIDVYVNGGWQAGWGGTSDSSPATAALVAELSAFDGHSFGLINPLLYSMANDNLTNKVPGVPTLPKLVPMYQIQNWSNDATGQNGANIANFHGATNFNLSAGWGTPLAWNIANLAGKPWISTNPETAPVVGSSYWVNATVQDYRPLTYVNLTYRVPGQTTWSNTTLSLVNGNSNKGVYSGYIPGSALTTAGKLHYCIQATDALKGNSWSPWNQSGWEINAHGSSAPWTLFGCTHPFNTTVAASSSLTGGSFTLNETGPGEIAYSVTATATFTGGTSTYTPEWCWGDGGKTAGTPISGSPATATHSYAKADTFIPSVYINDSAGHWVQMVFGTPITVYNHVSVSTMTPSVGNVWTPPTNLTFSATPSNGLGPYTYSWNFDNSNTSTLATPPYQIYYKPGTYPVTLTVTDSLGYHAFTSYTFTVFGSSSTITLLKGPNLIALPTVANSYTLYEMSVIAGPAFLNEQLLSGSTTTNYDRTTNAANGNVAFKGANALWLNVSAAETITVYGNTTGPGSIAGVAFGSGWSGIGFSVTGGTHASTLAAEIPGAMEVSIFSTATGQWSTFIVGWDTAGGTLDFAIGTGTAVLVWTFGSGTFTE
jgi:hypothetical protein